MIQNDIKIDSKSAYPSSYYLLGFCCLESRGQLVKLFLKALGEIAGTGKAYLEGHFENGPEIFLQ